MTQAEAVRYRLDDDGVAIVSLNRPEVRNAIDPTLLAGLDAALHRVVDDGAEALVLTGEGPGFCAGADLKASADLLGRDDDWASMWAFNGAGTQVMLRYADLPVPVVAAVNGAAAGAGMGYALAADVRILARSARLVPRFAGLGVTPDNATSYYLARFLGAPAAVRFLLRDVPMSAEEALGHGIADQVVEDADLLGTALAAARELRSLSPRSLRGIRQLTFDAPTRTLSEQLEAENRLAAELWPVFRDQATSFVGRPRP